MKIGKYHIIPMPIQNNTGEHKIVIYSRNPRAWNFNRERDKIGSFTVTAEQEREHGSLVAAITAYMSRNYPQPSRTNQRRCRRLQHRERRLQADIDMMIRRLLALHGGRIMYHPEPDEDGCVEYPVSMALYDKHDNPTINITDVYLDEDGILRTDGTDDEGSNNRGFQLYPEHYSWALDFITIALGFDRPSPWSKVAARMESRFVKCCMAILVSVSCFLHLDPLSKVYRRVRSCTDYSSAYKILEESGLILSEYGCYRKASEENPELSYAYYTADGSRSNPRGITVIYTFRQTGRDSFVADKITSIVCNR